MQRYRWEIYTFSLPLLGGGIRSGFTVRIESEEGSIHWGEISPFPGRSLESREEVLEQLLGYLLYGRMQDLSPSVQFGLESLFSTATFPLYASTYALLNGPAHMILDRSHIAKQKGYSTVKVKLGQFNIEEAQYLIHQLKEDFRLRIDCNRAFSFSEAIRLFSPFDPSLFDYIEDPTYELDALSQFTHPIALDETLTHNNQLPVSHYSHLYGFVVKPSLLGGRKGCLPLLRYAKEHHLRLILSSAFETGLGLLQIIRLGQELDLLDQCIGLDTHRFLQQDLLDTPFSLEHPHLCIEKEPVLNRMHLKQIAHGTSSLSPL